MGSGAFGNTGISGGSATDATITFSDTVALAQNKKVQNTLTIFQYTSTASVVA